MIRILGTVTGIFATATVLTAALLMTYFWGEGNLNQESAQEIVAILKGEPRNYVSDEDEIEKQKASIQDIKDRRAERILSIAGRESELAVLKQAIEDQTTFMVEQRKQLEQLKKTFREELVAEREKIASESVEQARAILLKMETEAAVEKLMALELEDAVRLFKGMAEKDAAKILDQFRQRVVGNDPQERLQKAEDIYKAIYQGEPLIGAADDAQQAMLSGGEKNLNSP